MKNAHPVVVVLALAWLALEAAVTLARILLVPCVALLLTLASWRPAAASRPAPPPPPAVHPLAALVEQLTTDHTRRQLQQLAGTRANLSKATLAGMVAACS